MRKTTLIIAALACAILLVGATSCDETPSDYDRNSCYTITCDDQFSIHFSFSTGTVQIYRAKFGEWTTVNCSTTYGLNEKHRINGKDTYFVLVRCTSDTTFSGVYPWDEIEVHGDSQVEISGGLGI